MSKAGEFFKKVSEDNALNSAIKAAVTKAGSKDEEVQAVAKIATEAGFDVSAGELKDFVEGALRQAGELSDSELENVAGGVGDLVINTGDINVTGAVINVSAGIGDAVGTVVDTVGALAGAADAAGATGGTTGTAMGIVAPVVPSVVSGW
ncbi:MAG: Nif11-like leader peptide family RiPP precursor [Thermincola sp.]|jgi:predicted ribosomally synthesized peptide with nif11-like leader|nr:Nif11-like leader peptide family RiPP precursor [Thermincola sp.]MDT3702975.1 Nif11-like leader peptide family RiPP precursor [Thermincola sp.]